MAAAKATVAGLSTLGVKLGYAVQTAPNTLPTAFTQLERCNSIGGISMDLEQIDASALEDLVSRYVAGRQDTGGTWEVTFNATTEVIAQLNEMIDAYNDKDETLKMCFEVWAPGMSYGYFVYAQPPQIIPMPEFSQNELQTVSLTFSIEEYVGPGTAIEPTRS